MTSETILQGIEDHFRKTFGGVFPPGTNFSRLAAEFLDEGRAGEQIRLLEKTLGQKITGLRFLEIGSGFGTTVGVAAQRFGARAFGIEPGTNEFSITYRCAREYLRSRDVALARRVLLGFGERLPFRSGTFDVVYSTNVLEHVDNPAQVLAEAIRVLAPNGHLQFVVPNYASWWEGHYGLPWIPGLPKSGARLYVRLFGRDASFIDTLQFVTPKRLRTWLRPHTEAIEILGWGLEIFEDRARSLNFSTWASLGRLKAFLRLVHTLGLIRPLLFVVKIFEWYTPIVLTLRKRAAPSPCAFSL